MLGFTSRYTNGLSRLAADNLDELCGIQLSHTTMGELADATAGTLAERYENTSALRDALREVFQKAKGETEFYADGTCIRTRNDAGEVEHREVRVGAFAKRVPDASVLPSEWATRKIQKPTVLSAFAAIEGACKNLIGKRMKQTGACWRVPRANRIAILCAALYSNKWKLGWKKYH